MHRSVALHALLAGGLAFAASLPAAAQPAQGKTHVGSKPSGLVSLFANAAPGETVPLNVTGPDGSAGPEFVLPPGTALVVTDLVANLAPFGPPSGLTRGGLKGGEGSTTRPYFSFYPATEGGDRQHFTGGVLWTMTPPGDQRPRQRDRGVRQRLRIPGEAEVGVACSPPASRTSRTCA